MPRILGVDIPNNKKLAYSLRYIYGIGPKRADIVLEQTGLDPDMRAKDLDEEQINVIMSKISELNYLVEGDLRRDHAANMKRLQAIIVSAHQNRWAALGEVGGEYFFIAIAQALAAVHDQCAVALCCFQYIGAVNKLIVEGRVLAHQDNVQLG